MKDTALIGEKIRSLQLNQLVVIPYGNNLPDNLPLSANTRLQARRRTLSGPNQEVWFCAADQSHRPLFKLPMLLTHWYNLLTARCKKQVYFYYGEAIGHTGYHLISIASDVSFSQMLPKKMGLLGCKGQKKESKTVFDWFCQEQNALLQACQKLVEIRHLDLWTELFAQARNGRINAYALEKANEVQEQLECFANSFKAMPIQYSLSTLLLVCIIGNDFVRRLKGLDLQESAAAVMEPLNQLCCEYFHPDQWLGLLVQSHLRLKEMCMHYCCQEDVKQELRMLRKTLPDEREAIGVLLAKYKQGYAQKCGLLVGDKESSSDLVASVMASNIDPERYFYFICLYHRINYLKRKLEPHPVWNAERLKVLFTEQLTPAFFHSRNLGRLAIVSLYLTKKQAPFNHENFRGWLHDLDMNIKEDTLKTNEEQFKEEFDLYWADPEHAKEGVVKTVLDAIRKMEQQDEERVAV